MAAINWMNGNAGFISAILTFIYVLATVIIVIAMTRANKIASKSVALIEASTELGQKTLSANQRPWVAVEPSLHSPINLDRNGDLHVPLSLKVSNVGKTPALNIWCPTEIHIRILGGNAWNVQKLYCTDMKNAYESAQIGDPNFAGVTLFPNQERAIKAHLTITHQEIKDDTNKISGTRKPILIIGCVLYRSGLQFDAHQTWFIFEPFHHPVNGIDLNPDMGKPGEHGSIIYESVTFDRYFVGDYAD